MTAYLPSERSLQAVQTVEPLDSMDRHILAELQAYSRIRTAELARRVGLSPPAVADRMRRLERTGALTFRVDVNPRALGYTINAIVRISPWARDHRVIPQIARDTPEVLECYSITGDDCYFMKVCLRSVDDLDPLLDRFAPYGRTTTSIVRSVPVRQRNLPLT
jgi:Lrp/AsnC family transcriptional regulator, leucine-responsive regulatory protein